MKRLLLLTLMFPIIASAYLPTEIKCEINYQCTSDKYGLGYMKECAIILSECVEKTFQLVSLRISNDEYSKTDYYYQSVTLCVNDMM